MLVPTPENGFRETAKRQLLIVSNTIAPWFQPGGAWENASFVYGIKKITIDTVDFDCSISGGKSVNGDYKFSITITEIGNVQGRRMFFGVQYSTNDLNFHTTFDPPHGMGGGTWSKYIQVIEALEVLVSAPTPDFDKSQITDLPEDISVSYAIAGGRSYVPGNIGTGVLPPIVLMEDAEEGGPSAFDNSEFVYTYNEQVVRIDADGTITALQPGISIISAYRKEDEVRTYFSFFFEGFRPGAYAIADTSINLLALGPVGKITFHPTPVNIEDFAFSIAEGSPADVISVGTDGIIVPLKPGTTTIMVDCNQANGLPYLVGTVTVAVTANVGIVYTLNLEKVTKEVGETVQLKVSPTPFSTVTWVSNDPTIASVVSGTGVVTALKFGKTTLTATFGDMELEAEVDVASNAAPAFSIDYEVDSPGKIRFGTGVEITVTGTPGDAPYVIHSSNPNVISVGEGGSDTLTGVTIGTSNIWVTCEGKTSEVRSVECSIPEYAIVEETLELEVGQHMRLTLEPETLLPGASLVWGTSNPEAVSVDSIGNVKGLLDTGVATVDVTLTSGGTVTTVAITVATPETSYTMLPAEITVWENIPTCLVIDPPIGDQDVVEFFSSDGEIASFSNRTIVGHKQGFVTVTAVINGVTVETDVTVKQYNHSLTPSILDPEVGDVLTFEIDPEPNVLGDIAWSITPSSRGTIDEDGVLTCIKHGPITVTATFDGRSATTTLNISRVPVALPIVPANPTVDIGERVDFSISGLPEGVAVTWTAIALVDGELDGQTLGTFLGASTGTVTVTAEYNFEGRGYSTSTVVTVTDVVSDELHILPIHLEVQFGSSIAFSCSNPNVVVTEWFTDSVFARDERDTITFYDIGSFVVTLDGVLDGEPITATRNIEVESSGTVYVLESDIVDPEDVRVGQKVIFSLDPAVSEHANVVFTANGNSLHWVDRFTAFVRTAGTIDVVCEVDGNELEYQIVVVATPLAYTIDISDTPSVGGDEQLVLVPEVSPEFAVTWSLDPSDGSVATVDGSNVIHYVAAGEVTVTAEFSNRTIDKEIIVT